MSRLKKDMEYLERQIIQNNQEIEYLEKYIKKKEGVKNGKISGNGQSRPRGNGC